MGTLSKVISLLLAAILIFFLPLQYLFGHQLALLDNYIEEEVAGLVDDIREKEYLDVPMYEEFLKKLNAMGVPCNVDIEHAVLNAGSNLTGTADPFGVPVASAELHSLASAEKDSIPESLTVIPSSYSIFNGAEPIYTVNPNIVGISAEPASQSVERYGQPSFTVTAHYEDGTEHLVSAYTVTGFDDTKIGSQDAVIYYTENSVIKSCNVMVTVSFIKRTCDICGKEYYLDENDFDRGCPACREAVSAIQASPAYITVPLGGALNITITAAYRDGHTKEITGWDSNYDPTRQGTQLVTITYQGKTAYVAVTAVNEKTCDTCGYTYLLNEDGTDPGCPECREYLVSINADPSAQTVNQGENINLTVTAVYRDGHSAPVTGWRNDYNAEAAGEQTVTVYYKNKTCNVKVTVVPEEEIQCRICGTYYNYREDPFGCPVCAGTLTGIKASLINGGTRTAYGASLELAVILTYRDGDRVLVYNGWKDNFDPYTLGSQNVTVSYTDIYGNTVDCPLAVEVADAPDLKMCENGHLYDPIIGSCPYCAALNGDGISIYSECHYTEEILGTLYEEGKYDFSSGDFVTVKVTLKTEGTMYSMGLFREKEVMPVVYGGEVA